MAENEEEGWSGPSVLDVLVVKAMLMKAMNLPVELVDSLLDHAEYWPHTTVTTDFSKRQNGALAVFGGNPVNENKFLLRTLPLGFPKLPPKGAKTYSRFESTVAPFAKEHSVAEFQKAIGSPDATITNPCRKIVFTLRSHDQGWGGQAEHHGTYKGSWTWFEAGLERFDADPLEAPKHEPGDDDEDEQPITREAGDRSGDRPQDPEQQGGGEPEEWQNLPGQGDQGSVGGQVGQPPHVEMQPAGQQIVGQRVITGFRGPPGFRGGRRLPPLPHMPHLPIQPPINRLPVVPRPDDDAAPPGDGVPFPGRFPDDGGDDPGDGSGAAEEDDGEPGEKGYPGFPLSTLRPVYPETEPASNGRSYKLHHELTAPEDRKVQCNKTATRLPIDYRIEWSWLDDIKPDSMVAETELTQKGRGSGTGNGEFVRQLKLGDVITLWAMSRFPGWLNSVEHAQIDVYWAV